jgi:protein-S-isoprenylcysteine O-methyltransferase Ste14
MRHRGDVLVIAQFVLLALLLLPGPRLWNSWWTTALAVVLAATGVIFAVAGLVRLGRNIVPWVAPNPGAPLETGGIYRFTRNPIYLGILIGSSGWVLWRGRIELVIIWVLLVVVLSIKAHVEQRHLLNAYGEAYRRYAEQTPLILWGRGIR